MVVSTDPAWEVIVERFEIEYGDAVVYADREGETVLHEGALRVLANGWVELPSGRLLSPEAVHHVDAGTGRAE